jgi:hypothetical protein
MGIAGFLNHIKKTFVPSTDWLKNSSIKKYDYLFLDYQSMFYSTYELFSSEINYFLRLIYYIKYVAQIHNQNILLYNNINVLENPPSYEDILRYIFEKYIDYFLNFYTGALEKFLPTRSDTAEIIIEKIDFIFTLNLNDKSIIIKTLATYIVRQTDKLSNDTIKDEFREKKKRTYIFFDGIPSLSKIKEQLTRRINGIVIKNITNNILESDTTNSDFTLGFINSKLLSSQPPSIGLNSEIVKEVKKLLDVDYYINSRDNINKYGEAEHQIMKYITDNKEIFLSSEILISSPDADLILLIFIKRTNNFRIDLLKQSTITELKINKDNIDLPFEYQLSEEQVIISPYGIIYEFIIIDNLLSAMGLKLSDGTIINQSVIDISFLFLLLGDDFIPAISTMDIYKTNDLLGLYKKLSIKHDFKIINIDIPNKINFINLKLFINELSKMESKWKSFNKRESKTIEEINASITKLEYIYFFNLMNFEELNIQNFRKSYFFEKGIILDFQNNPNFSLLKKTKLSSMNDEQIHKYLQGYSFILDIYFNNTLKNYKWIYNYEKAPTLAQINKFLEDKNDECVLRELFDYTKKNNDNYLDTETYLQFTNDNQTGIIRKLLEKIMISKRKFGELGTLESASHNKIKLNDLCKKYFIYDEPTLDILFNCNGERFLNKCVDIENYLPISITSEYERPINKALLGGYYQKYLKYKNKYMSLKIK